MSANNTLQTVGCALGWESEAGPWAVAMPLWATQHRRQVVSQLSGKCTRGPGVRRCLSCRPGEALQVLTPVSAVPALPCPDPGSPVLPLPVPVLTPGGRREGALGVTVMAEPGVTGNTITQALPACS